MHMLFQQGTECAFSHDIPQVKKDEPCKFYVMSQCTKEGCLYRHDKYILILSVEA